MKVKFSRLNHFFTHHYVQLPQLTTVINAELLVNLKTDS